MLDQQLLCKATTVKATDLAYPFTNGGEAFSTSRSLDCREEANGPLAPSRMVVERSLPTTQYDAVFVDRPPRNCTPLDDVTRWRHGFEIVLSTLARCTVDPPPLTSVGVTADDPVLGTTLPGDLWGYATDGWQQWPGRTVLTSPVPLAELAFRPDASCGGGCLLAIAGTGPPDLAASVDGEAVAVTRSAGRLLVPISAAQADDNVWVTLRRSGGGVLGIRMTGLSLVRSTAVATKGRG